MIWFNLLAALLLLSVAPLCAGIIKKFKAVMQNRHGFPVLQPYYDLQKLLNKGEVLSPRTTVLFRAAPYIYFIAVLTAAAVMPVFLGRMMNAGVFVLVGLLAVARFVLALAAFDAGSAFANIGAERELFFSAMFEPAFLIIIFVKIMIAGNGFGDLAFNQMTAVFDLPGLMAAIAFFMLMVAESGRIPVDNPDTHLELTMVHEAMLLEYSGKRLALITWAAQLRQLVYIVLFVQIFIPWQLWSDLGPIKYTVLLVVKIAVTLFLLAVAETMTNKMRVFRVPGYVAVAVALAIFAVFAQ